jgi:hypothetical protein
VKRRLSVLIVFVSLLSGCGGRTFDSIKKMVPIVLLVSLAVFTSASPKEQKELCGR